MKITNPQDVARLDADISPSLDIAPTGTSALTAIASWSDLPSDRRRRLAGYVERAAEICAVPLDGLIMQCAWLNERFYAKRPMAHGLSRASFGNVATALRFVLERLGEHEPRDPQHRSMTPEWRDLLARIENANHRAGLAEFARFCGSRGLIPDAVQPDVVEQFEYWARNRLLHRDVRRLALNVERLWAKAQEIVPEWPSVRLHLPRVKKQMSLPTHSFPRSFAEDLIRFEAELAGDCRRRRTAAPSARRSRVKPARPATIATRRRQVLLAAGALVSSGIAPEQIRTLRDLVEPLDHADRIFEHFWTRAGNEPSSHTAGIAAALKRIACIHCDPPPPCADQIGSWARELTPQPQNGLTKKNRSRLAAMVQARTRRLLLNLPGELAERARGGDVPRKQAVSLMQTAVAIEILLHCPIRLENLRSIRLGVDLMRLDPRSPSFTHLSLAEDKVKNGQPLEWRLTPETAKVIDIWRRQFRTTGDQRDDGYLFPGREKAAISDGGLHRAIKRIVADTIGIEVNPHLFRHFAVWLHLKHHPGDYETARRLLGHSTVATTVRFYAGLEAEAAAERHDAIVLAERREGRSAARAEFRKSRPKQRRRKGDSDA